MSAGPQGGGGGPVDPRPEGAPAQPDLAAVGREDRPGARSHGVRAAALVVAVALTAATAWLSRAPVTFAGQDEALLRLSWRLERAAVEACRVPTEEELAELPVHMRNPDACIGRITPYLLVASVDGRPLAHDTARAPGARADRPITVFRELPLPPGRHDLEVTFTALLSEGAETAPDALTRLAWSGPVELGPREVALVTVDATGRALEVRTPGPDR